MIAEVLFYPFLMLLALLGYGVLTELGMVMGLAAYLVVGGAVLGIAIFERAMPAKAAWKPGFSEAANDLTFLVFVQMLLPFGLGLGVMLGLEDAVASAGWAPKTLWPHHWPTWAQVALMLVAAEFPRYWLHRLGHNWAPLWRFHAVHHAPKILYWLNVGRFHPVDKAIQFLGDSLPFILLGVGPDVLKLYFVFYAVNGFFQHSNCRVRLGPLNWVIAGPELHRWHHSVQPEQSNNNYGNNLIIWDSLFGTRFLPKTSTVADLGLLDHGYPTGFLRQMTAPFRRTGSGA